MASKIRRAHSAPPVIIGLRQKTNLDPSRRTIFCNINKENNKSSPTYLPDILLKVQLSQEKLLLKAFIATHSDGRHRNLHFHES